MNSGRFDVVVMAASAGGLNAITRILSELPGDFGVPVLIVQHLDPKHQSHLAEILSRRVRLRIKQAEHGEPLCARTVYIAPPDKHLLIGKDFLVELGSQAQVQFVRPSADLLFESAAEVYGGRTIAVVLTGTGHDGAQGVRLVRARGGVTIAQDQSTSEFFGMPGAAIGSGAIDYILPLDGIAAKLIALVEPANDAATEAV